MAMTTIPLSPAEWRDLQRVSNWAAVRVVAGNIALVGLGFALPILWPHLLTMLLGAAILAGRILGFAILMHDASHNSLFAGRVLNEGFGRHLFAAFIWGDFDLYRTYHREHHRLAGSGQDPDLALVKAYPASSASLRRKFWRDISGQTGVRDTLRLFKTLDRSALRRSLLLHAGMFALLALMGSGWAYVLWWVGFLFLFPAFMRLRIMGEHGAVPSHISDDPRDNTATTLAGPLMRLFVAPNRVNYHLEHHMAAGVPSYRLPRLHQMLVARGYYDSRACIAPNYGAVLRRCSASAA